MNLKIHKNIEVYNLREGSRLELQRALSFENPQWAAAKKFGRSIYGIRKRIELSSYDKDKDVLIVPRGALRKVLTICGMPDSVENDTAWYNPKEFTNNIELRPVQRPWVDTMMEKGGGLGVAPAGSGKTVMALEMIARLGQPTLWLTHRKTLMQQFIKRAGLFLCEEDIGIIGGGKVKLGRLLTVGMVQTIAKKDMSDIENAFGLVIVDEAHIIPTMQASASVSKFAPRHIYGLTATPYREDKMEQVMFDTIGPIAANMDRDTVVEEHAIIPAIINVRTTNVKIPYSKLSYMTYSNIIEDLMNNENRNKMILNDVLSEMGLGNICIILTNRIEHGIILKEMFESLGVGCAHSHSKLSDKNRQIEMDRFLSGEVGVMIATYQLLGEGFDHSPTSRIFFALPYKARTLIEQSKGRIERIFDGKDNAVVYDYVDDIPMLVKQFKQRLEYYNNHNLKIVHNTLL